MPQTFKIDEAGNEALFEAVAYGFHDFGNAMADLIRVAAPPHTSRRKVAYKRTISATTYLNGSRIAGQDVKIGHYGGKNATQLAFARSMKGRGAAIETIVYTTSALGHILEFGTQPHVIPVTDAARVTAMGTMAGKRKVHHPGSARRPHFGPGFLASRAIAGRTIAAGVQRALGSSSSVKVGTVSGRLVAR